MAEYAVVSDIHGNLFALEAVMKDMSSFAVEGVIPVSYTHLTLPTNCT